MVYGENIYRDWLAFAFSEKVPDPDGAQHPEGRFGHRGQTPFPQLFRTILSESRFESWVGFSEVVKRREAKDDEWLDLDDGLGADATDPSQIV